MHILSPTDVIVMGLSPQGQGHQGALSTPQTFGNYLSLTPNNYSIFAIKASSTKMASPALRTRALHLRLRNLQPARLSSSFTRARPLQKAVSSSTGSKKNTFTTPLYTGPLTNLHRQVRPYSASSVTGRPPADLLVEELQDLYEIATDEFEIATDSTDSATIYAASDRESARDALNQFIAVYHLYSGKPGEQMEGVGLGGSTTEGSPIVETNYNPKGVSDEVRDEVRRRVGQRVRELRSAVVVLEERARAE